MSRRAGTSGSRRAAGEGERERLRILFFTSYLGGGGAEKQLVRVANHLDPTRWEVHVVVTRGGGSYEAELAPHVRLRRFACARMRQSLGSLRRLVSELAPDIVCPVLDHASCIALLATIGARSRPIVVPVVQAPPLRSYLEQPRPGRRMQLSAMRVLFPRARHVIALSQGVRDDLEELVPGVRGRVSVIPNACLDGQVEEGAAQAPPPVQGEGPVLVACGRLVPQKGYDVLLRALALLRQRVPARLRILGEGPLLDELRALAAELNVADAVSFEGFQANPFAFMRAADVFVLSSGYEGFGNVIVEAMAVGTPVVATDCPYGPDEILEGGRYGCLVPPGDPRALADALARVLADPALRARMSAAGRERARAFSSQAIAGEYAALFERVLPDGARAAATVSPVLARAPRAASAGAAPAAARTAVPLPPRP